jgi:hypothetical protein
MGMEYEAPASTTSELLLLHVMLGLMWAALVLLTWITWRHQQYISRHECCWTAVPVIDAGDEEAWAAVTEAFRDTHSDLEVSPR